MMKRIFYLSLLLAIVAGCTRRKTDDRAILKSICSEVLSDSTAYHNLKTLCTRFSGRICGSDQAAGAAAWADSLLRTMGLDTVYRQPLMVKKWDRGEKETGKVLSPVAGEHPVTVCALGWSAGTGPGGITAGVVEVTSREQLQKLGEQGIRGKIVFYNQPMDPAHYYTFESYGEAYWQRGMGASLAARYGAVAVVVRSLTTKRDDFPHTGIMHYADSLAHIPAFAISTLGADSLYRWLRKDPALRLFLRSTCREMAEVPSCNVIGEIRGSEKPREIIAFGGHVDAWDITQGAHDDGIGVVQTVETMRVFKKLGIRPKHTLRIVVFMDEEVAQRGAEAYAAFVRERKEKHLAAIETDRGGFSPYGFSIDAGPATIARMKNWLPLLEPYGIWSLEKGGSGVDIHNLKPMDIPLMGLVSDSQRYFDYQHAASDTWETVHPREMQLGSWAVAAMVYLIDEHGLQ